MKKMTEWRKFKYTSLVAISLLGAGAVAPLAVSASTTSSSTASEKTATNNQDSITTGTVINLTANEAATAKTGVLSVMDEGAGSGTTFETSAEDKATTIDANNLTEEQSVELSSYAADLINKLRAQAGISVKLVVTSGAINFANTIASNYNSDAWNGYSNGGHDVSAIEKAAASYGLRTGENYYENLETWSVPFDTKMTMAYAKELIYGAIYNMMFNDSSSSYGHTVSLLGINTENYGRTKTEYFAVSFDEYGNIHLEIVADASTYIVDTTTFAKTFDTTDMTLTSTGTADETSASTTNGSSSATSASSSSTTSTTSTSSSASSTSSSSTTTIKNGQVFENGYWYLYKNNVKQTGFQYISDQHKTVYYNSKGQMLYGQQKINGYWYLFDKNSGAMKTGFQYISNQHKTVYYNSKGQMLYGQQKINGYWYLFDSSTGAMKTGFQYISNQHKTVYYNSKGQMLYGQQKINGYWYLFDSSTGAMKTGFQYISNQHKTVYYNSKGQMLYGQQKINGYWYLFDSSTGAMKTGFQYISNQHKTVYYNSKGQMLYGQQKINGKIYRFNSSTGALIK